MLKEIQLKEQKLAFFSDKVENNSSLFVSIKLTTIKIYNIINLECRN